jgi:RNA-directed DNA polymerase
VLIRLNQIMLGWAHYFKHAVAKRRFNSLDHFTWWRLARMLCTRHHWSWKELRRKLTGPDGHWQPIQADGVKLAEMDAIVVSRYRYRGVNIPTPWGPTNPA